MIDETMLPADSVEEELEEVQALEDVVLPEIKDRRLVFYCVKGKCLNVECYRGFAPAKYVSSISQPDVYNQFSNPEGTQRELSISKAKDAYAYMDAEGADPATDQRFMTEVVLNVRRENVVEVEQLRDAFYKVTVLLDMLTDSEEEPDISRVEGNHRLTYAHGFKKLPALDVPISFCLISGINKLMEAKIFRDINSNQKPMQTSHLDNIDMRIDEMGGKAAEDHVKIAFKLSRDLQSPFLDIVYAGGKKAPGQLLPITLRSLGTLVRIMQAKSEKLSALDFEQQYHVIRAYWKIISGIFQAEWNDSKKQYLLMRSAGTIALAFAGATAINDLYVLGKIKNLADYLEPLRGNVDWSKNGPAQGLNGVGGATQIYNRFLKPHLSVRSVDHSDIRKQIEQLSSL
jgi:DGQHR domain-containing protein